MWLNQSSQYKYLSVDAIKKSETQLQKDIDELKTEIEVNELVHGVKFKRPFSSVPAPTNAQVLAAERKYFIEKLLQTHDVRPTYVQADVMQEQIENATEYEYSLDNIPILMHQFFIDRIHCCVQAKHLHLLRWKRFSEHTSVIEELYPDFKNRVGYIISEYNDAVQRAQRLSLAREQILLTGVCANALSSVVNEDLQIYLRWLVSHFTSIKPYMHFMKLLEWFPYLINTTFQQSVTPEPNNERSLMINELDRQSKSPESRHSSSKIIDNLYLSTSNAISATDETLNAVSSMLNKGELPLHNNSIEYLLPRLRYLVHLYKIDYDLSRMHTSGDEMELFASVNRKFRHLFATQEHMKTFRVYDMVEAGHESWGTDSPIHALKKEANWIQYIQLVPRKDPNYEKAISKIRTKHKADELLLPHSKFIEINNDERIQDTLRENAPYVKAQPTIQAVSVTSNKTQFNSKDYWKKILAYAQSADKIEGEEILLSAQLNNNQYSKTPKGLSFGAKTLSKRSNEFNFMESLQKYGLDDSSPADQDLTGIQGSYLSFLLLRHLRIRDLKRQALSVLNYFRSIERTLTIYDGGLSLDADRIKKQTGQNHFKETSSGGNLGYHAYMFNTPKDFKLSELEFMEFSEIENHDDFYCTDDVGNVHVQDQRGYFIMYDVAINDLKKIEEDLLLIASYYIEKDKETKQSEKFSRISNEKRQRSSVGLNLGDLVDIAFFSHQNVDRFNVLLDIWTNEANFLEMKRKALDLYFEAYQNVFDKTERRNLAQIITDIIHRRPRLDLDAPYFVDTYRLEISNLHKQIEIVKLLSDRMMNESKELSSRMSGNMRFGMSYPVVKKHIIQLSPSESLKNLYMLEFHPELGVLSRIPQAIESIVEDIIYKRDIKTINERLICEKEVLGSLFEKYQVLDQIGYDFSPQIQKEIFSGDYVEDPFFIDDFTQGLLKDLEESLKNKTRKEQSEITLTTVSRVLEMVTLRFRLINSAMETAFLSKIYRKQANEMGFDDFHLYMRYIQFDFARSKDNAGKPPPLTVTELTMEESNIDRYVPSSLYLAIHELDEGQIGKLSFRSKETLQQLVKQGGVENLQIILKLQLAHNNILIGAIMQAHACSLNKNLAKIPVENKLLNLSGPSKSSLDVSAQESKTLLPVAGTSITSKKSKPYAEAFVSVQMEKNPSRDLMLNSYIQQKQTKGLLLSNPSEMEKLKRSLMNDYIAHFSRRISQYSLRAQLITLYYSISKLLENFPNTRNNHFVFGEPHEKRQTNQTNTQSNVTVVVSDEFSDELKVDPRMFKKRPRKLLSDDGKRVLNIWFIPHYTESLMVFKKQPDDVCCKALKQSVKIISALNDIMQILYAHACLSAASSGPNTMSSISQIRRKTDFSSWENAGGLGSDLNDIQQELNSISNPTDPEQVIKLLEAKRSSLILRYDCAVRHAIREIFLANGNITAYKHITENIHFALRYLSDYPVNSIEDVYLNIPEPLDSRDLLAQQMFPWRNFISKTGIFPLHYWQWYLIEPYISLCLTGLKEVEKSTANGEILGVTLMTEDIIYQFNEADEELFNESLLPIERQYLNSHKIEQHNEAKNDSHSTIGSKEHGDNTDKGTVSHFHSNSSNSFGSAMYTDKTELSKMNISPLESYAKLKFFLITWKRLEILKSDWIRRKFSIEEVNSRLFYGKFCESYKKEVLFTVIRNLARRVDAKDFLDSSIEDNGPLLLPKGVSELESKFKQIEKLLEKLEVFMITDTLSRLKNDLRFVLNERGREEHTLTTDLWKKPIMKEQFTIIRPDMLDKFIQSLHECKIEENSANSIISFRAEDLNDCLVRLGSMIQERERSNFEQYTMFYENLLRLNNQELYAREREVMSMKEALQIKMNEIDVEVKCQMTDACYDLLMEVTALRAKIQEMTESNATMEKDIREKIKAEFIDLVTDLVNVNIRLKSRFDTFRESLYGNVCELIAKCRAEAFELTSNLKTKFGSQIDELALTQQKSQATLIEELQKKNHELTKLVIQQKFFTKLRLNKHSEKLTKSVIELTDKASTIKKKAVEKYLLSEQKEISLEQQRKALQKQLKKLDIEYNTLKNKLDKEIQDRLSKEHEAQQRMKNEKNLHTAKQSNVDKLFEELESKDAELRNLYITNEKHSKTLQITETKVHREMTTLKRQLTQERNLKLDAFQKIDELQTQVYDLEDEVTNISTIKPQSIKDTKSIRSTLSSATTKYSSPFPRLSAFITQNTQSAPLGNHTNSVSDFAKPNGFSQRPKTAYSRVRSIVDTAVINTEKDPGFHDQVSKLKQIRLKSAVS